MIAQKLAILLCVTLAYGASIIPTPNDKQSLQTLNFLTYNTSYLSNTDDNAFETLRDYEPMSPNDFPVANSNNNFEIGKVIAEVSKRLLDIFSKMDLSEQNLKPLVELMVHYLSQYFGPYTQVIVPVLSGIATVFIKSLADST